MNLPEHRYKFLSDKNKNKKTAEKTNFRLFFYL